MNTLSEYATGEFEKFVQNKQLQKQLNDVIAFYQLSNIDEVIQLYLDMFLLQVEIAKLDPHDIELLRLEIRHVRSVPINKRNMTSEVCDQVYGGIKMLDGWTDADFDKRIREGRATKRLAEMEK